MMPPHVSLPVLLSVISIAISFGFLTPRLARWFSYWITRQEAIHFHSWQPLIPHQACWVEDQNPEALQPVCDLLQCCCGRQCARFAGDLFEISRFTDLDVYYDFGHACRFVPKGTPVLKSSRRLKRLIPSVRVSRIPVEIEGEQ